MVSHPLEIELRIVGFLFIIWACEKLTSALKFSSLLGSLIAGILLGPPLLDIVPFAESWQYIGQLGVLLLVIESGILINLDMLLDFGVRAILMAATGVIFPVALGMLLICGILGQSWKVGLAISAAFAPTSLGFATQLLKEYGIFHEKESQFICTAAIIDDVFSLLLLAQVIASTSASGAWSILSPFVSSLGSIAFGIFILYLTVRFRSRRPKISKQEDDQVDGRPSQVLFMVVLFLTSAAFSWASDALGSSALLGAFLAAIPLSQFDMAKPTWNFYMHVISPWTVRIFFAATIGFAVPKLIGAESVGWNWRALWFGILLSLTGILGKCFVGVFTYNRPKTYSSMLLLGLAMCGRGEFSFLIIGQAAKLDIVSEQDYAAAITGLLITAIISPLLFRWTLSHRENSESQTNLVKADENRIELSLEEFPRIDSPSQSPHSVNKTPPLN